MTNAQVNETLAKADGWTKTNDGMWFCRRPGVSFDYKVHDNPPGYCHNWADLGPLLARLPRDCGFDSWYTDDDADVTTGEVYQVLDTAEKRLYRGEGPTRCEALAHALAAYVDPGGELEERDA